MNRHDKHARLLTLAMLRQRTQWPGYHSIAEFRNGVYECDHVSPYTTSAGNVDADVMVLLQDWSGSDALSGALDVDARDFGYTRHEPTNGNLERRLLETFGLQFRDVYATNLFPFIKPGGMSARILKRDLLRAATEFALPQIEIVSPKLVICLGMVTFNAVRAASGLAPSVNMQAAIDSPFALGKSRIWFQAHTGHFGQISRNKGGVDRVAGDWLKMKGAI